MLFVPALSANAVSSRLAGSFLAQISDRNQKRPASQPAFFVFAVRITALCETGITGYIYFDDLATGK